MYHRVWSLSRNLSLLSLSSEALAEMDLQKDNNRFFCNDILLDKMTLPRVTLRISSNEGSHIQGDIMWDKIVSIEYCGYEHVYDIEVEGTHNFIGNNIFAHNTYTGSSDKSDKSFTGGEEGALKDIGDVVNTMAKGVEEVVPKRDKQRKEETPEAEGVAVAEAQTGVASEKPDRLVQRSFIKIATAGQKMRLAEIEYSRDTISQIEISEIPHKKLGNIIYNEDSVNQFLSVIVGDTSDRSSPEVLQSLRPFLGYIVEKKYSWLFYSSPNKTQYETIKKVYEKIKNEISIDPSYRAKLVEEIKTTLISLGDATLRSLVIEITEKATLEFERSIRDDDEIKNLCDFFSPFTVKFVVNNPSPVNIDTDNHILELNLFAFLEHEYSDIYGTFYRSALKLELRKISAGIILNDILSKSNTDLPQNILMDVSLILLDDFEINKRSTLGNKKIIGYYDQSKYIRGLKFYGARQYVSLLRRLSNEPQLDEKIRLIYTYLTENFDTHSRYNLSKTDMPSLALLTKFITNNFEEIKRIQKFYRELEKKAPSKTERVKRPGEVSAGPIERADRPIERRPKIEVEHLRIKEEREKEDRVPPHIFAYSRRKEEERERKEEKPTIVTPERETRRYAGEPPEYVTPNRGEDYYINKILKIHSLLDSSDEAARLKIFLGQIFSWYLVARADHADGRRLRRLVLDCLDSTVSDQSNDNGFKEDIKALMDTKSSPQIRKRKLAARFRNNPYLLGLNIYFGVDLGSAQEGRRTISVLYALTYEIDEIKQFTVYNRHPYEGEKLPIDYLGNRIDILDKEMYAFGFTWRGDTFGAVIKQAVKRYVFHNLKPILEDKPYLVSDDSVIHPLTYSISAAVKRDLAGNNDSEIVRKVELITAMHELQHTVDEILRKIRDIASTETSAYLASIAISDSPYIALVKVIELYVDSWAPIFAPFHYRASVEIMKRLKKKLGINEEGDRLNEANAVLKKALDLKDGELADLARDIHRDLFGEGALVRLERGLQVARLQEPAGGERKFITPYEAILYKAKVQMFKKWLYTTLIVVGSSVARLLLFNDKGDKPYYGPPSTLPPSEMTIPFKPESGREGEIGIRIIPIGVAIIPGDILSDLAERYYGNGNVNIAHRIAEYNNIPDVNTIFPGRILILPNKIVHIVKAGQSFGKIADMYNVREEDLKEMNPHIPDYSRIYPGDKIVVAVRKPEGSPAKCLRTFFDEFKDTAIHIDNLIKRRLRLEGDHYRKTTVYTELKYLIKLGLVRRAGRGFYELTNFARGLTDSQFNYICNIEELNRYEIKRGRLARTKREIYDKIQDFNRFNKERQAKVVLFKSEEVIEYKSRFEEAIEKLGEDKIFVVLVDKHEEKEKFYKLIYIDYGIPLKRFRVMTYEEAGIDKSKVDTYLMQILGIDDLQCIPLTPRKFELHPELKEVETKV